MAARPEWPDQGGWSQIKPFHVSDCLIYNLLAGAYPLISDESSGVLDCELN